MNSGASTVGDALAGDPLSAIAPLLRVRPEIQDLCRFASRWEAGHEAERPGWGQFHIGTKGCCLLGRRGGQTLRLEAGNPPPLPPGYAHRMPSGSPSHPRVPRLIDD